jgi:hypothetical protein
MRDYRRKILQAEISLKGWLKWVQLVISYLTILGLAGVLAWFFMEK